MTYLVYLRQWVSHKSPSVCYHRGWSMNAVEHTREDYLAWAIERAELFAVIGGDLLLPA